MYVNCFPRKPDEFKPIGDILRDAFINAHCTRTLCVSTHVEAITNPENGYIIKMLLREENIRFATLIS